jgi:hypothetical protein
MTSVQGFSKLRNERALVIFKHPAARPDVAGGACAIFFAILTALFLAVGLRRPHANATLV